MRFETEEQSYYGILALALVPGLLYKWQLAGGFTLQWGLIVLLMLVLGGLAWLFRKKTITFTADGLELSDRFRVLGCLPYDELFLSVVAYETNRGVCSAIQLDFLEPRHIYVSLGFMVLEFQQPTFHVLELTGQAHLIRFVSTLIGYDPTIERRSKGVHYDRLKSSYLDEVLNPTEDATFEQE